MPATREHWPTDGHEHKGINPADIFTNKSINSFLGDNRISLIIAGKGMGKTLLLRVKRNLLRAEEANTLEPLLVIPSGRSLIDEPQIKRTLSKTGFSDVSFWKHLWSLSIILSILTYIFSKSKIDETDCLIDDINKLDIDDEFKYSFLHSIEECETNPPSHFIGLLMGYREGELRKLCDSLVEADHLARNYIRSGVVVLIDAFDQALREAFGDNNGAWIAGQVGLAKAAHSLFTTNPHIKIIASIRQEAWAGFSDDQKEVIGGKAIILDYTKQELRAIFENAIQRCTDKQTVHEFLCSNKIFNKQLNEHEDPFLYILRHSIASPRALMHFGRDLDNANLESLGEEERQERIREVIDDVASVQIRKDYIEDQKSYFLNTLRAPDQLDELLRTIPCNVLTSDSLRHIHSAFCKRVKLPIKHAHPFCELFNIGLIGKVQMNIAAGGYVQYFRRPHEFDWRQEEILEKGTTYVIHPGLTSAIVRSKRIAVNRVNIVGPGLQWKTKQEHEGIPKLFVSYSSLDRALVEHILKSLTTEIDLRFPSEIWFDKWRIEPGQHIHQEVEKGISSADIAVLFASQNSLKSGWVDTEWRQKHQQEIETGRTRLIVVIVDDMDPKDLPEFLRAKLAIRINKSNARVRSKDLADSMCHSAELCIKQRFQIDL